MSSDHDRERPGSDGRDAAVARAWRRVSDEQPPPRIDDRILAAARQAVSDEGVDVNVIHTGRWSLQRLMRWQPLAAAATVAGLAFVLLQLLPRERDVAPSIRMEAPAPGAAPVLKGSRSPSAQEAGDAPVAAAAPGPVPRPSAEAAGRAAMPDVAAATRATEADSGGATVAEPASRAASELEAAPAQAFSAEGVGPRSAAERAASVAALLAAGDAAGAADELRAFRAADPDADAYLPESLRAWARTVR
jgi:hypothetical protein